MIVRWLTYGILVISILGGVTGCAGTNTALLVGTATHSYALAYSIGRHVVEWPEDWWRVFYYDGTNVMVATIHQRRVMGQPQRISHCSVAPVFSVRLVDGVIYIAYTDGNGIVAYLRAATREGAMLRLAEPLKIVSGQASFSVQAPSIAMSPEKRLTLVYRSTVGSPNRFPVHLIQAKDWFGTRWGDPIEVSTPTQCERSGAGTSGAAFWPGGQLVVILAADVLYANVQTPSGWAPHVIDAEYRGVHDWSAAIVDETLYLAYRARRETEPDKTRGTIRWICYRPNRGWSDPVDTGIQTTLHSVALGVGPDGAILTFGYEERRGVWYARERDSQIMVPMGPSDPHHIQYPWVTTPEYSTSAVSCAWTEGAGAPYKIYCWIGTRRRR